MSRVYHKPHDFTSPLICPRCGSEPLYFFRDNFDGEILGCSECAERISADDLLVEETERMTAAAVDLAVLRMREGERI